MTARTQLGGLVLVIVTMTACSASTEASDTSAAPTPTDAITSTSSATTQPPASTTVPPTTLVPPLEFQFATIELTSPDSGSGDRPQLTWEAVEGTSLYQVTVFAPNGRAYWATQTGAISVHVGGEPQLDDDAAGPSIVAGMTWQVIAIGDDRMPLAVSERSPISP